MNIIGQDFETNRYGKVRVVGYCNAHRVFVVFHNTGYFTCVKMQHLKKGSIMDRKQLLKDFMEKHGRKPRYLVEMADGSLIEKRTLQEIADYAEMSIHMVRSVHCGRARSTKINAIVKI